MRPDHDVGTLRPCALHPRHFGHRLVEDRRHRRIRILVGILFRESLGDCIRIDFDMLLLIAEARFELAIFWV
jgi:hypothetical protein